MHAIYTASETLQRFGYLWAAARWPGASSTRCQRPRRHHLYPANEHYLMIEHWDRLERLHRGDYKVFSVHEERSRSPRTDQEHTFFVIDSPDWVNVIPVTEDGRLVFIRQYRHGTKDVTLEVPGGMIDPGDGSPEAAARREMLEETGYDSDDLVYLGQVAPNPAIFSNRCHTCLARDARRVGEPSLEGAEDIELTLVAPEDVPGLVLDGTIDHALVVTAFYFYDHLRESVDGASSR